ncbi:MAG: AAA family ATPase [Tabrizicola sp.]|nr:AAA family ATPase [Tabrizicola sp.]
MQLQERENQLLAMQEALAETRKGSGRCLAILGEAGIGKTSLLRAFLADLPAEIRILRGACEDLTVAEPLGPLRDLAREAGWQIEDLMAGGRIAAFSQILAQIEASDQPTVIVVEDLHWADDGTVDFLKYLARRLEGRRILMIVTARGEDAQGRINTRQMVAGVPPDALVRIELKPLSLAAIQALSAGSGLDAQGIWQVTGGNPFYVSEVTKFGLATIPLSVEDAVLARLDAVPPAARTLARAVSVFPRRAEIDILRQLVPADLDQAMDDCLQTGLLEEQGTHLSFRHEIARLTVEAALPASQRRKLHGDCLTLIEAMGAFPAARLLHHARQAGDDAAIRRLAPLAGAEALQMGPGRSTVEILELALEHNAFKDDSDHAELLEKTAWSHYLCGNSRRSIELQNQALSIFRQSGETLREGDSYRRLARFHWVSGKIRRAHELADQAVRHLHQHRGPDLAMALSTQAQLHMLDRAMAKVIAPAEKAIEIAQEFGRPDIESHALNNLAQALWMSDVEASRRTMDQSIEIALQLNDIDHVARGYTNAIFLEMEVLDFGAAERRARLAVAYSAEHELDGYHNYCQGALAWTLLRQGRLDEADMFGHVNFDEDLPEDEEFQYDVLSRTFSVACAQVWLSARRGQAIPPGTLTYLAAFMRAGDELQRLNVYASLVAELAWLGLFDRAAAIGRLREALDRAESLTLVADSAIWLKRLDPAVDVSDLGDVVLPYRLEAIGDCSGAAKAWEALGASFDQAMALAQGSADQRLAALQMFQRMGAHGVAHKLADDLRAEGHAEAPPRPRLSTLHNPLGLTNRQMDVLRALADGLSNQEIGRKLFVSPKTVDHHVSAILAKLDASTRGEAAAKARKLSLI